MGKDVSLVKLLGRVLLSYSSAIERGCALKRWESQMRRGALLSVMGLTVVVAGCHGAQKAGGGSLLSRITRSTNAAPRPGELAEQGRAAITEECGKQSYETAKKGLVVSEIGLHEDVFVLRDRVTYAGIGYSLDEALRLESLLEAEVKVVGAYPADQASCIRQFAAHLETVSDPLVEEDARQKELDASAFSDSEQKAQQEAERVLRGAEKENNGATSPVEPKDNY